MSGPSRFDLTDKTVIVTGGVGLVGRAVCEGLNDHGATVVVADVAAEDGRSLTSSLDEAMYVNLDVTDIQSIEDAYDEVEAVYGPIDGLVNAAYPRTEDYGDRFEEVTLANWNRNVEMQLGGYFATCKEVAVRMVRDGTQGSIVNFGSIYGVQGPDFSVYDGTEMTSPIEYSAIKGGILNLTRYLASYLGPDGIRVNAVSPGGIFDNQDETFVENYEERTPLGRMATPEDVVGATIFLLSDASAYVTGHNLVVDGGWTTK